MEEPDFNTTKEMYDKGFYMVDRTILATVPLKKNKVNFDQNIRMEIEYFEDLHKSPWKERVKEIAQSSFDYDSRFQSSSENSKEDAIQIIHQWVENINGVFLCMYEQIPVGFLETKELERGCVEINLAAVEEKYRISGAAVSMYNKAASVYKEKGYKSLVGRISSKNTAVMNLYISLGAMFSCPQDVYFER